MMTAIQRSLLTISCGLALCFAVSSPAAIPLGSQSVVAISSPSGLVASTGNLYWTSKSFNEFGSDTSTVWRAGKNNVPGNEIALYQESGDDRFFGDIVFANPGAFFGYFVASYQTPGGLKSQIKRVPLTGGAAVVIADTPAPKARDLLTDGTKLFWIDAGGIRSVPIGGGPITTLFSDGFVGRISLDGSFVYFGEEFLIMRIPKNGGSFETIARTNGRVSALHVDGTIGWVFWGEKGGRCTRGEDLFRRAEGDLPATSRRPRSELGRLGRAARAVGGLPPARQHQLPDQKARGRNHKPTGWRRRRHRSSPVGHAQPLLGRHQFPQAVRALNRGSRPFLLKSWCNTRVMLLQVPAMPGTVDSLPLGVATIAVRENGSVVRQGDFTGAPEVKG